MSDEEFARRKLREAGGIVVVVALAVLALALVFFALHLQQQTRAPAPVPVARPAVVEAPLLQTLPRLGETRTELLAKLGPNAEEMKGRDLGMAYDSYLTWKLPYGRISVYVWRGKVASITVKPPVEFWRFHEQEDLAAQVNYMARESVWTQLDSEVYGCTLLGHDSDRLAQAEQGRLQVTLWKYERAEEKQ